jgi:hypothetical protein
MQMQQQQPYQQQQQPYQQQQQHQQQQQQPQTAVTPRWVGLDNPCGGAGPQQLFIRAQSYSLQPDE